MGKLIHKLRYKLLGKQIQKQMEMAEIAGNEAAELMYREKLEEVKNEYAQEIVDLKEELSFAKDYIVEPKDIISARSLPNGDTALVFLGKDELTNQEVANLQQEVKFLRSTRLWGIINNTLKQQAQDIMFTKSNSFEDMRGGKMMLRNLDVQEKILSTIEKFDQKKP